MLWVNAANRARIKNIVSVHDCIGCHAPDVDKLRNIGLKALRDMYTDHDVLAHIWKRAHKATNQELPRQPDRGAYDYDNLLKAINAFS